MTWISPWKGKRPAEQFQTYHSNGNINEISFTPKHALCECEVVAYGPRFINIHTLWQYPEDHASDNAQSDIFTARAAGWIVELWRSRQISHSGEAILMKYALHYSR
jgi:hypothetical protein